MRMKAGGKTTHNTQSAVNASQLTAAVPDWKRLSARVQTGNRRAAEDLYCAFSRGLRYLLARQLRPQEAESAIHDTLLVVVSAIREGRIPEPETLPRVVRMVAQAAIARAIAGRIETRRPEIQLNGKANIADPTVGSEPVALVPERTATVRTALSRLRKRDREIVERFYLRGQAAEQICAEMNLTEAQFRLRKSRAKPAWASSETHRLDRLLRPQHRTRQTPD